MSNSIQNPFFRLLILVLVSWCCSFASCKEERIPPAELMAGLKLWPLPCIDTLHVSLQHRGTGAVDYTLFNMQGQPLLSGSWQLPAKKPLQTYLLLGNLPVGQYVLQCAHAGEEHGRRIVRSNQEAATFD